MEKRAMIKLAGLDISAAIAATIAEHQDNLKTAVHNERIRLGADGARLEYKNAGFLSMIRAVDHLFEVALQGD